MYNTLNVSIYYDLELTVKINQRLFRCLFTDFVTIFGTTVQYRSKAIATKVNILYLFSDLLNAMPSSHNELWHPPATKVKFMITI